MMEKIKGCPFCGNEVKLVSVNTSAYGTDVVVDCDVCSTTFTHRQNFAVSRVARVAINDSFLTVWNRRVSDEK